MRSRSRWTFRLTKPLTAVARALSLVALMASAGTRTAGANEIHRPKTPTELPIGTGKDRGYRVKTAKVAIFNRVALERDFPRLAGQSDAEIEAWILDNFAYINVHQLKLTGIRNTKIDFDHNDQKDFFIPPGVGRGAVVETRDHSGMVDLKATGNSSWNKDSVSSVIKLAHSSAEGLYKARERDHSSGLETYDVAGAEYLRQFEIQNDYDHRNQKGRVRHETVESYFLIDYGFNLIYPNREIPAFMHARQAHFGRTANNRPLIDEIYNDRGEFQESYTEARIDFGGSRTKSENELAYHSALKLMKPSEVKAFILENETRIRHQTGAVTVNSANHQLVTSSEAKTLLSRSFREFNQAPRAAAIGRHVFDMERDWAIDVPSIARLKYTLNRLPPPQLNRFLDEIGAEAVKNLFYVSMHAFQMPLPLAVYHYGLDHDKLSETASGAAAVVFSEFPSLVKPTVAKALQHLKATGDSWAPSSIGYLIGLKKEFPGYEDFLRAVINGDNSGAKRGVLYRLSEKPQNPERVARLTALLRTQKPNRDVVDDLRRYHPAHALELTCDALFVRAY